MKWRERSRVVRAYRLWRTRRPVTFTEKVQYKMLRDHRPLLVTFADKAAVRSYVADKIGPEYLPRSYAILDDPQGLDDLALPPSFVVKPTHGSGAAIVVSPDAPADAVLPKAQWGWVYAHVRPDHAPASHLIAIAASWLSKVYGQGPNKEWAYSRIPPRVLIEEMLAGESGGIPDDFKFFVFHGSCRYIQVDTARFGGRTQDFYSVDWEHLPLSGGPPWACPARPKPERLDEMIQLAERLGTDTDFVRVDLYHLPDRIVFGELTSYPAGGHSPFHPDRFDTEFGTHWAVPRVYTD